MLFHPVGYILHDAADIAFGSPRGAREELRAVAEKQAQVGRAVRRHAGDGNFFASDFLAERGKLAERGGVGQSAGDVAQPAIPLVEVADLFHEQVA